MLLMMFALIVAPHETLTGKVVAVHDGDTLTILVYQRQVKVRLAGIDAPESKQAFGTKAKQSLSSMVFGKVITVEGKSTDRYGRTVGNVRIDGTSVNERMLRAGMAWHFKRYDKSEKLAAIEQEARTAKRGLWVDPRPEAPWDYRARSKRRSGKSTREIAKAVGVGHATVAREVSSVSNETVDIPPPDKPKRLTRETKAAIAKALEGGEQTLVQFQFVYCN